MPVGSHLQVGCCRGSGEPALTAGLAAARQPTASTLVGRYARLVPLEPGHADTLAAATQDPSLWRYMAGAPAAAHALASHIAGLAGRRDMLAFTIFDVTAPQAPRGFACYMRIEPAHAVMEIGNILFTPALQRTSAASEALFLMLAHAFDDLGMRRVEWKCDSRNAGSRTAALRLGFTFEGIFRQHMIVRGENRDTAWFALLDGDWPLCSAALSFWLAPENRDEAGRQRQGLAALRRDLGTATPRA